MRLAGSRRLLHLGHGGFHSFTVSLDLLKNAYWLTSELREKKTHDALPALFLVNTEKTTEKEESELALENLIQKRYRWIAVTPGGTMASATAWASWGKLGLKQGRLFRNALIQEGGAGKGFQVGVVLPYQARSNQVGNTSEWKMCL